MKKWFPLLLLLFIIYFSIQLIFKIYSTGHTVTYQLKTEDKKFQIKEKYSANRKNDIDNYFFEISYENEKYYVQTSLDYKKKERVLKEIYHIKANEYSCIYPIFLEEKVDTDVICVKNNIQYNYHTIRKEDTQIDSFVNKMKLKGYDATLYVDRKNDIIKQSLYTLYPNNIVENHFVAFNTYKGIQIISNKNEKIKSIALFDKDVYNQKLKAITKDYYFIVNYNQNYEFDSFYLVNIENETYKKIELENTISFDSYIQGVIGNDVYLFDKNSNIQYKINTSKNKISVLGDEIKGYQIYENGKWETKPLKEVVNREILFDNTDEYSFGNYKFLGKSNDKYSGYYYYYEKVNDGYQIYRANVQSKEQVTYLTTITSIDNVKIAYDYIYFIENNEICYYHDLTGVRTLLTYNELQFNKNLTYFPYSN